MKKHSIVKHKGEPAVILSEGAVFSKISKGGDELGYVKNAALTLVAHLNGIVEILHPKLGTTYAKYITYSDGKCDLQYVMNQQPTFVMVTPKLIKKTSVKKVSNYTSCKDLGNKYKPAAIIRNRTHKVQGVLCGEIDAYIPIKIAMAKYNVSPKDCELVANIGDNVSFTHKIFGRTHAKYAAWDGTQCTVTFSINSQPSTYMLSPEELSKYLGTNVSNHETHNYEGANKKLLKDAPTPDIREKSLVRTTIWGENGVVSGGVTEYVHLNTGVNTIKVLTDYCVLIANKGDCVVFHHPEYGRTYGRYIHWRPNVCVVAFLVESIIYHYDVKPCDLYETGSTTVSNHGRKEAVVPVTVELPSLEGKGGSDADPNTQDYTPPHFQLLE